MLAFALAQVFQLHGAADVFFGLNTNRPADHASFIAGTGTTASRANELSLNAASVELVVEPKPVGLHLTLAAGAGPDVVHNNVLQASASYVAGRLALEAGIYPSHIGFETFFSKDDWNYTRSWMGELSPYYQLGAKATWSFDEQWSAQVHVLNGWQLIADDNRAKAIGTQVAYNGPALSVSFNTFAGPELPGDDSHWRLFGDVVAVLKVTPALSVAATTDAGWQDRPASAAAWFAGALYVRNAFTDRVAAALRVEAYDDRDGFMSGTPQTLREATATLELRPDEHLIMKLEAREDAAAFAQGHGTQTLFVASAVATF